MAITDREWQDEIGSAGIVGDGTRYADIDTSSPDIRVSVGSRTRGAEQTYVALYPLLDGRWCFYRSLPRTRGKSWVVGPTKETCEDASRNTGEASRIGVSETR